ncbi:lytic transglycosylase domain-containing protein [Blattabacterium cuenoti]|uniref:lytic transglycosylase domain-containing protein n=1 Tax=Blattabacterium cuenoti TaxID=1653831 RepID=UPI00163BA153|nr:lytic transglycosylase domain-containing protein [Blattabacterium cuenoti]
MVTITTRNIVFFMIILKSLIIQSLSKPFIEHKNVINFHKNINHQKLYNNINHQKLYNNINNIHVEKLWIRMLENKKKIRKRSFSKKRNHIVYTNIDFKDLKFRLNILNQKSQIKILNYNSLVHASIESYLRMSNYIEKIISLSYFYFPMFEEKLKKFHLPKELKYLAIIESNLNPFATSKVGAQGIWQFMPETGKIYDLNIIHNVYDDRNDPVKSTEAACRYLKFLYKKIGNWELVLAAYNAGPGTVDKILQRYQNNKKDFWSLLEFFPKETQNYIPKFIAINYVMNYYKEHNIASIYHKYKYKYKDTVLIPIKEKISLKILSFYINIPYKDLIFLNPQYLVDYIPFDNGKFFIRLPKNKIILLKKKNIFLLRKKES